MRDECMRCIFRSVFYHSFADFPISPFPISVWSCHNPDDRTPSIHTTLFFSLSIPHRCFRHTYISHPVILHNLNIPLCSLFVGTPCISFSGFECLDPHTLFSYCLSLSWLHHSFLLLSIHLFWCHITPTYHCMSSIVDPLCREELLLALSAGILLQLYKTGSLSAFGNIDVCLWL